MNIQLRLDVYHNGHFPVGNFNLLLHEGYNKMFYIHKKSPDKPEIFIIRGSS